MRLVSGAATVAAIALLSTCAQERPLEPHEPRWTIFAGVRLPTIGPDVERVYMLDADSLHVFDSLPFFPSTAVASPDGRYFFATICRADDNSCSVSKTDLNSHESESLPSATARCAYVTQFASGGRVLYERTGYPECQMLLISPDDGKLIRQRDGLCKVGEAPQGARLIPAVALEGDPSAPTLDTTVHVLDAETGDTKWTVVLRLPDGIPLALTKVVLHPDGNRLLALGYAYTTRWESDFVISDIHTGSPLLVWPMTTPTGDITVSRDGRYAMVSDARDGFRDWAEYIDLIDLDSGSFVHRFYPTAGFPPSMYRIGEMEFLQDDRTVIFGPDEVGPLRTIDINSMTVGDPIWLPYSEPDGAWPYIKLLAVGPGP